MFYECLLLLQVVAVIHQPRYETLRLFDDLVLLEAQKQKSVQSEIYMIPGAAV